MYTLIEPNWQKVLSGEFSKEYFLELTKTIEKAYLDETVFPLKENIFRAFTLCPFTAVKVIILGQDPYHGVGQAHGLSFSVPDGQKIPPSLRNIYKELKADLGKDIPVSGNPIHPEVIHPEVRPLHPEVRPRDRLFTPRCDLGTDVESGNLEHWAKQGVLLLNATLTVLPGQPASHQGLGWETFTDQVIRTISEQKEHVVFILWGKFASAKQSLIDENKHLILTAPHPSPFSAYTGFFGSKHFSQTNNYLEKQGLKPIDWTSLRR